MRTELRNPRMALLAASLALLVGCGKAPPPPEVNLRDAATNEVRAIDEQVSKAYQLRDSTKAASFYALEANLMMGNSPVLKGLEIPTTLKTLMGDTNFAIKLNTEKVDASKSGDMGYSQGTYDLTMTDPKSKRVVNEKGKFLTLYAKQDAGWKIIQDMTTPDAPAAVVGTAVAAKGKQAAKGAAKGKAAGKRLKGAAPKAK